MFLFPPDTSNHCLCVLNTAQPGESRAHARGESASGESESRASNEQVSEGQVLALEQASEGQVLALEQQQQQQQLQQQPPSLGGVGHRYAWHIRVPCLLYLLLFCSNVLLFMGQKECRVERRENTIENVEELPLSHPFNESNCDRTCCRNFIIFTNIT